MPRSKNDRLPRPRAAPNNAATVDLRLPAANLERNEAMTRSPLRSMNFGHVVLCTAFATLLPTAFAAHGGGSGQERAIGVHDGRYVAGGQTHASLDTLDSAVRAARPASVLIVACASASTSSWLATVPRFDDLPMHLDVSDGSSPACRAAMPASVRQGATGMELDAATRRYWSGRQP
jgi:hypothetical protein